MTKPSNFILNSDYLSLAGYGTSHFTLYIPAGVISQSVPFTFTRDMTVPAQSGSIDRIIVAVDGSAIPCAWTFGFPLVNSEPMAICNIYRTSPTNVRFKAIAYNYGELQQISYPAHKVDIYLDSFKPPNIF